MKNNIIKGVLAGLIATGPMTASMMAMWRWLPWWQKSQLPPERVTSRVLRAVGLEKVDKEHHTLATWVAHFGYGAMAGAIYPLVNALPLPSFIKSALYGLGVWVASYLGWLPATKIMEPATEHPMARNMLMIVAHIVWGVVTGSLFKQWSQNQRKVEVYQPKT